MNCPICGTTMQRGWLMCGMPCVWTSDQKGITSLLSGGFLQDQDDIRLPKDETGRPAAWRCEKCRKLIIDF